jgi:hypothetical protein
MHVCLSFHREDEKAEALRSVNFTAEELQQQLDAAADTEQVDTPAAATAARPSGGATRSPTDTNLSGQQLQEVRAARDSVPMVANSVRDRPGAAWVLLISSASSRGTLLRLDR